MNIFRIMSLLLGLFVCRVRSSCEVSVSCMMVYDEGGAAAVYRSPECPDWNLTQNQTLNCQFATIQGWREHQEDRISCDLDMKIPFLGKRSIGEMRVGVVGVFDGHGGSEASEMASKLLMDYFLLHASVFYSYKRMTALKEDEAEAEAEADLRDEPIQFMVLKEALLRTIHEIDLTFSKEALGRNIHAGTTAAVAVILDDGQILVGNVGDSKALLCSENKTTSPQVTQAMELTRDHHPDRDDERARIEASGGSVVVWGVPRVNGILAMSRALGDVNLKRYGVISTPELTSWRAQTADGSHLVVASDGIFETLTPHDICNFISHQTSVLPSSSASSLADYIVNIAFERGSTDNLSVIVVPLSKTIQKEN